MPRYVARNSLIPSDCRNTPLVNPFVYHSGPWVADEHRTHPTTLHLTDAEQSSLHDLLASRRSATGRPTMTRAHILREALATYHLMHFEPTRKDIVALIPLHESPAVAEVYASPTWWKHVDSPGLTDMVVSRGFRTLNGYLAIVTAATRQFLESHPNDATARELCKPTSRYASFSRAMPVYVSPDTRAWLVSFAASVDSTPELLIPRLEMLYRTRRLKLTEAGLGAAV